MTAAPPLFSTNHILPFSPSRPHNWSNCCPLHRADEKLFFSESLGFSHPQTRFLRDLWNSLEMFFCSFTGRVFICGVHQPRRALDGQAARGESWKVDLQLEQWSARLRHHVRELNTSHVPHLSLICNSTMSQFMTRLSVCSKQLRALKNFYIFGNRGEKRSRDSQKRSFRSFFPLAAINSIIFWWYLQFVRQHSSEKSEKKKQRIVELSERIRSAMMSSISST